MSKGIFTGEGLLSSVQAGEGLQIAFRDDLFKGPRFFVCETDEEHAPTGLAGHTPCASEKGIRYEISYAEGPEGSLELVAKITNERRSPFQPKRVSLKLGVDTRIVNYPDWRTLCYPTFMRCESTHFWGYFGRPDGAALLVASPDPVASWHNDFRMDTWGDGNEWGGTIIETTNLDLLHCSPLPSRHPQGLHQLAPQESRTWRVRLHAVPDLANVQTVFSRLCEAPVFGTPQTSQRQGGKVSVSLFSEQPLAALLENRPNGELRSLPLVEGKESAYEIDVGEQEGEVVLQAFDVNGKRSEARLQVHRPWESTLEKAGRTVKTHPPHAATHCEAYYGFFSGFLAAKHGMLPGEESAWINEEWDRILPLLVNLDTGGPISCDWRIQNLTTSISQLVDRYEAFGNEDDLVVAARIADFFVKERQAEDGSYRSGKTHYTCVIYPAKSMLELAAHEAVLGEKDSMWKERADRHYESVRRAADDLERRLDNIQTEGVQHFEDGMIGCSSLQLGLFALTCSDPAQRARYQKAALTMLRMHGCLAQVIVPDGRIRGGTHRTWEAQFDVFLQPAVISCPHGWAAWRAYGTFYAYLLTGEEEWLLQTLNALGAMSRFIDTETGSLNWAFVLNPYIEARQAVELPTEIEGDVQAKSFVHPNATTSARFVAGEEHLRAIRGWSATNSCDPDTHEAFKCMEETFLSNAFVFEREDGSFLAVGCSVARQSNGSLSVCGDSDFKKRYHLNLRNPSEVVVSSADSGTELKAEVSQGMKWIFMGESGRDIHPWMKNA